MRRAVAILLLAATNFLLVSPVFARPYLPACCRMHGKHQCSLMHPTAASESEDSSIAEKCPFGSRVQNAALSNSTIAWRPCSIGLGTLPIAKSITARSAMVQPADFYRGRNKRGPPSFFL